MVLMKAKYLTVQCLHPSYFVFSASSSTIFHSSEFGYGGCCLRKRIVKSTGHCFSTGHCLIFFGMQKIVDSEILMVDDF